MPTLALDARVRCGKQLRLVGTERFRIGGTIGAAHFWLGAWGELSEDMIPMEVLVCPACRHIELRAPAVSASNR